MIEAGLLIAGEDIPVSYDRFRDRIMFPIADLRGRVIAFGGRALAPDAQAKYLNSPETPLFHKSHVLYNGQAARAASRKGGQVIAVEGYIDVIACVAAGFEATVAPLGTALTEDQLRLLWQMADEPILCFDGDEAGLKAAFRAVDAGAAAAEAGQEPEVRAPAGGAGSRRFHPQRRAGGVPQDCSTRQSRSSTCSGCAQPHGLDLATPERRAGLEQALRAAPWRHDRRSRRAPALRDRGARAGRRSSSAQRRRPPRRAVRRAAARDARGSTPQPTGPSASLLLNPLVRERGRGAGPSLGDAVLLGVLLLHPEIAAERLESLAHTRLCRHRRRRAGRRARARNSPNHPGICCGRASRGAGGGGPRRSARRDPRKAPPARALAGWPTAMPSAPRRSGTTLPTCVCAPERYLSSGRQRPWRSVARRAMSI